MYVLLVVLVLVLHVVPGVTEALTLTFWSKKWIFSEKKYIDLFLAPRSLPESDGHRDHGGIGGAKNNFFFLIVFQRLMP